MVYMIIIWKGLLTITVSRVKFLGFESFYAGKISVKEMAFKYMFCSSTLQKYIFGKWASYWLDTLVEHDQG